MRKAILTISMLVMAFAFSSKAFALTVSPAKVEVRVNPGQSASGEIEIFNEEKDARTFYSSFENFESRGDSGAPYFTGGKEGLASWIDTVPSVTIEPGERKKIGYTIYIPKSATPGGYFSAIFFGSEKPKQGEAGSVSIGGKIGVLVLLSVNGDVKESAGLSAFKTKEGNRFYSETPVTFEYNLNNTGGDRVVPKGELIIKNTFRMKTATLLANDKEGSVLPNSTRKFNVVFGTLSNDIDNGFFATVKRQFTDFHFGWYTAELSVSWGESKQAALESYNFFMIPWQLLIVVFVVCLVLKLALNIYKKRVIAEAAKYSQKK